MVNLEFAEDDYPCLTSAEVMAIDPEMAARFLNEYKYSGQRSLSEWNIDELKGYIQKDEFEPGTIKLGILNGRMYLIDGQHRLTAVALCGKTFEFVIEYRMVKDRDQLKRLYARTDRGHGRSHHDVIYAMTENEAHALSAHQIDRVCSAASVIATNFASKDTRAERLINRSGESRYARLLEWEPFASDYFATIKGACNDVTVPMQYRSPLSVILVTFRYSPDKARQFWLAVAQNSGLIRGTQEHSMVMISTYQAGSTQGLRVSSQKAVATHTRMIAACWNSYFSGGTHSRIVSPDPEKPILIKGSPFRGE